MLSSIVNEASHFTAEDYFNLAWQYIASGDERLTSQALSYFKKAGDEGLERGYAYAAWLTHQEDPNKDIADLLDKAPNCALSHYLLSEKVFQNAVSSENIKAGWQHIHDTYDIMTAHLQDSTKPLPYEYGNIAYELDMVFSSIKEPAKSSQIISTAYAKHVLICEKIDNQVEVTPQAPHPTNG